MASKPKENFERRANDVALRIVMLMDAQSLVPDMAMGKPEKAALCIHLKEEIAYRTRQLASLLRGTATENGQNAGRSEKEKK